MTHSTQVGCCLAHGGIFSLQTFLMPNNSQTTLPLVEFKGKNLVNSRELHHFLQVGRSYSLWIQKWLKKNQFTEDKDYFIFDHAVYRGGYHFRDFYLTLRVAIELIMASKKHGGMLIRRDLINDYFNLVGEPKINKHQNESK